MKRRQTVIGLVFLLAGLTVLGFALAQHPIPLAILLTGVGVAVLGALIIPASGAYPAFQQIVVTVAPYVPFVGGRRAGDNPPPLPPTPSVTVTTIPPAESDTGRDP